MDINTPRGQEFLAHEMRAKELFEANYRHRYIKTGTSSPAVIDAVMVSPDYQSVVAVIETKARDVSLAKLELNYGYEWLVTASKIDRCVAIAKAMSVPFCGFLYLIPDDLLLVKSLWHDGVWMVNVRREETTTPASCNGGEADRINAFIDMSGAKHVRAKQ
jgi:hypothetical protein